MTHIFLKRPILAYALNLLFIVVGGLSARYLSIQEYPRLVFPALTIDTRYENASPSLVENSITSPLEDALAGIEGVDSIESQSLSEHSHITLTLAPHIHLNDAMIEASEALNAIQKKLPRNADAPILGKKSESSGMPFMALSVTSSLYDMGELTHYAEKSLKNHFRSIDGVAHAHVWGAPYTYIIALDPQKMYLFGINAHDVTTALETFTTDLPCGYFHEKTPMRYTVSVTPKAYETLVLRYTKNGPIYLKDVANITHTTDRTENRLRINGNEGVFIMIKDSVTGNPLATARAIEKKIKNLSLPAHIQVNTVLNKARFIEASLTTIQRSIGEAILCVLVIVFLFLHRIKLALIPLITIPISLIGSCIVLSLFGCSLNTITFMAMVLAIGLVVDDAIVMLEYIHTKKEEGAHAPALEGSTQIRFAIIAMTLTLISVYIPLGFMHGVMGQLFGEFAVALSASVGISGFVALTLTPLMAHKFLQGPHKPWHQFQRILIRVERSYALALHNLLKFKKYVIALTILLFASSLWALLSLDNELLPKEDRGFVGLHVSHAPDNSVETMDQVLTRLRQHVGNIDEADNVLTIADAQGGNLVYSLKKHTTRSQSAQHIVDTILTPHMYSLKGHRAFPWSWNSGLPRSEGSSDNTLTLIVSSNDTYKHMFTHLNALLPHLEKQFPSARHSLRFDSDSMALSINTHILSSLQLRESDIAQAIAIFLGKNTQFHFMKDGIRYPITLKSVNPLWDLHSIYLTTPKGKRVSLSTVANIQPEGTPAVLDHYNQMHSAHITVNMPKNIDLTQAMAAFHKICRTYLPIDYELHWSGVAKTYTQHTPWLLFGLCIAFIGAVLAVQFNNVRDAILILLSAPLALSSAILVCAFCHISFNIYTQIGLITLIGLITKHGVLMVEFARTYTQPKGIIRAARKRLRPILMTTLAMIFGVIPLMLSTDAGYEYRYILGLVLSSGLAFGTLFTLFVLPCFYVLFFPKKTLETYDTHTHI